MALLPHGYGGSTSRSACLIHVFIWEAQCLRMGRENARLRMQFGEMGEGEWDASTLNLLRFFCIYMRASLIVQLVKDPPAVLEPQFDSWVRKIPWRRNRLPIPVFFVAQLVKNPPAMRETWVQSLGWEDPWEKGKATHSSILTWRIPWTIQSMGLQRVGHD